MAVSVAEEFTASASSLKKAHDDLVVWACWPGQGENLGD
jgi:hypothetical protein